MASALVQLGLMIANVTLTLCTCTTYGTFKCQHSAHVHVHTPIDSLPGSHAWVGKSEPGAHCLCILSSPRISVSWEKFH